MGSLVGMMLCLQRRLQYGQRTFRFKSRFENLHFPKHKHIVHFLYMYFLLLCHLTRIVLFIGITKKMKKTKHSSLTKTPYPIQCYYSFVYPLMYSAIITRKDEKRQQAPCHLCHNPLPKASRKQCFGVAFCATKERVIIGYTEKKKVHVHPSYRGTTSPPQTMPYTLFAMK